MYKFSKSSLDALQTCHEDLQVIMKQGIIVSDVDFGISEGYRSPEIQFMYFQQGKSKIDGIQRKGKHNYRPSMACDYFAFIDGEASWDPEHITYLSGMFRAISEMYLHRGLIKHRVRWGGNWDMDGIILIDQTFDDRPHIELINP